MDKDQLDKLLKKRDTSKFTNKPYIKKVLKPWGYELHWVPEGAPYMGKIEHVNKGSQCSFQIHDAKNESWYLMSGRAKLVWEDENGEIVETEMKKGAGYTCHVGQKHRFAGITDCDIIEVSTPEIGNTFRLEDDYARPTETEEMRKDPNRGWKN